LEEPGSRPWNSTPVAELHQTRFTERLVDPRKLASLRIARHLGCVAHAIDRNTPVLVVDDYGMMIRVVRAQLRQLGFSNVNEANSGAEALAKLSKGRYGLIISDWHMAAISGLDLLIAVRGDSELRNIPFIMVTGESRTENVIAAKNAGVSGYIVKPFNAEMLKAKIESIFAAGTPAIHARHSDATLHSEEAAPEALQQKFAGRFTSSA
jgi:two-component system chemotaxis response regulator CheY